MSKTEQEQPPTYYPLIYSSALPNVGAKRKQQAEGEKSLTDQAQGENSAADKQT